MGRHSIRVKITILIASIFSCLIFLLLIFNNTLSEKVYLNGKQKSMTKAYNEIDSIITDYNNQVISDTQMNNKMEQVTSNTSVSVIVLKSDWTTVYSNMHGEKDLVDRLIISIFNHNLYNNDNYDTPTDENREIITKNDKYTLQKVYDNRLDDYYYELWGTLDGGDVIMIRLAIKGITDSVKLFNSYIKYLGLAILFIGIVAAFILSNYVSKPIKQLSDISKRMSQLDFNARYEGKDKGEIGILGNSMNEMSEILEKNISELKSANAELKRDIERKVKIDEMRTEFLSNVSHELKTPIALIQGYAEGLKEGISDDAESRNYYCEVIMDEAAKMNNMVKKLLTLNQIEFSNEELVMNRFDIVELINGVISANKLLFSQKGIKVIFNQKNENIYVWSDEYKIEEVITNYITNAVNHCEFDKVIDIRLERIDNNIRVYVFNTGKCIPKEDIDKIWIKFYKVDKARTREYGGNGIGLSIVKAIMDSYSKECGVENKENGVEFWFDLDGKAMV